jgi:hypothetical protein
VVLHAVALAGRVGALARGLHLRLEVAFAFALVVSGKYAKPVVRLGLGW